VAPPFLVNRNCPHSLKVGAVLKYGKWYNDNTFQLLAIDVVFHSPNTNKFSKINNFRHKVPIIGQGF
jgi:hypothetical protein